MLNWHFNSYEQNNFNAQSIEHEKSFITSGPEISMTKKCHDNRMSNGTVKMKHQNTDKNTCMKTVT